MLNEIIYFKIKLVINLKSIYDNFIIYFLNMVQLYMQSHSQLLAIMSNETRYLIHSIIF